MIKQETVTVKLVHALLAIVILLIFAILTLSYFTISTRWQLNSFKKEVRTNVPALIAQISQNGLNTPKKVAAARPPVPENIKNPLVLVKKLTPDGKNSYLINEKGYSNKEITEFEAKNGKFTKIWFNPEVQQWEIIK